MGRRCPAALLIVVLLAAWPAAQAQTSSAPLSLEDVKKLLEAGVSPARVKSVVAERGVDFQLSGDVDKRLRDAGATDEVVLQIAKSYRAGARPRPATPAPAPAPAAPPRAPSSPTADEILDRYAEAMGGRVGFASLKSITYLGTVEIYNGTALLASGTFQTFAKMPNKAAGAMVFPNLSIRNGFDGYNGWRLTANGLEGVHGEELARMKLDAVFDSPLRLRELYPTVRLRGRETIEGREAYALELSHPSAGETQAYFDVQTGLLIATMRETDGENGRAVEESYLDDYRPACGIRVEFTHRYRTQGRVIIYRLQSFRCNIAIDDAVFSPPR